MTPLESDIRLASKKANVFLWVIAFLITAVAVLYQRATGPTYPMRGSYEMAGAEEGTMQKWKYGLVTSDYTDKDALVVLPSPPSGVTATLLWRRYPTKEDFTAVPFVWDAKVEYKGGDQPGAMVAALPKQPAAGKLEYYLEVDAGDGAFRIPAATEDGDGAAEPENIIIRFKDYVPGVILWPHVFMMFFSLLIGMRAGLAALVDPGRMRRLAWITLVGMTIGGMMLGPIVQKYAFGHYWTGFPNGTDLTDNKMLIMWLSWIVACALIGTRPKPKEGLGRGVVLLAAIVMTGVYMIPHSMRGSELDYAAIDAGEDPRSAVGTGEE